MKKLFIGIFSLSMLFISCEEDIDTSFSLNGTVWDGKASEDDGQSTWTFYKDRSSLKYEDDNGLLAHATYEYQDSVAPVTIIVSFYESDSSNAGLAGKQWWGLVEYENERLKLGFKLPLNTRSFPTSMSAIDDPRIKIWELTEVK